jgi:hypothetical protein
MRPSHHKLSAAGSALNPSRVGIQWTYAAAENIEIQHRKMGRPDKVCVGRLKTAVCQETNPGPPRSKDASRKNSFAAVSLDDLLAARAVFRPPKPMGRVIPHSGLATG